MTLDVLTNIIFGVAATFLAVISIWVALTYQRRNMAGTSTERSVRMLFVLKPESSLQIHVEGIKSETEAEEAQGRAAAIIERSMS